MEPQEPKAPQERAEAPAGARQGSERLARATAFFDGCKPSCAWAANVPETRRKGPVQSCGGPVVPGSPQVALEDPHAPNVCGGGGDAKGLVAYDCLSRQPWTASGGGQRYAFAAGWNLPGCCECYQLTFLDAGVDGEGRRCEGCSDYAGELEGETVVVQVISSWGDGGPPRFGLLVPGAGFATFNGVASTGVEPMNGEPLFPDGAWGKDQHALWGKRYRGLEEVAGCAGLPAPVRPGCEWGFSQDGLRGARDAGVAYRRVKCGDHPELHAKSGCLLVEE